MLGWKPQQNVFLKNTLDSVILLSLIFSYTLIFLVVARIITKTLKKNVLPSVICCCINFIVKVVNI